MEDVAVLLYNRRLKKVCKGTCEVKLILVFGFI